MARILLIEDSPEFRTMVREVLQRADHTVVEATDGNAAVELLDGDADFDVVLTDIHMPGMDGIKLMKTLGESGRQVPVIAISGGGGHLSASLSLTLAEAFGARKLLFKPFRSAELLAAVDEVQSGEAAGTATH
ncbi:MAG TPA: response regulator [Woeseiaceae bacterium]|jgi:CheY-like chemotaxis protein|nr:response regulator [Woeseiaceae bacterium]